MPERKSNLLFGSNTKNALLRQGVFYFCPSGSGAEGRAQRAERLSGNRLYLYSISNTQHGRKNGKDICHDSN